MFGSDCKTFKEANKKKKRMSQSHRFTDRIELKYENKGDRDTRLKNIY